VVSGSESTKKVSPLKKKSIVITGSTRGIGLGLANEFLKRGCQVTINGRSKQSVARALEDLQRDNNPGEIAGGVGDVSDPATHQALWGTTVDSFGQVDIWINNAAIGHPLEMIWELPVEIIHQVVDINLKGLIFGSQTAVQGMLQQGFGHIYNMEGAGSRGRIYAGVSLYGTTKAALRYFSDALKSESRDISVKVSTLNPGMVVTDLVLGQYEDDPQGLEDIKRILNMIGDKVETVTPWLVEQILRNDKTGANINWLTPSKLMYRFATARFKNRDLFS
jgi:NAD(P)-dependent dehydrogenase (short-subunit alcohol dehydrogenase family)